MKTSIPTKIPLVSLLGLNPFVCSLCVICVLCIVRVLCVVCDECDRRVVRLASVLLVAGVVVLSDVMYLNIEVLIDLFINSVVGAIIKAFFSTCNSVVAIAIVSFRDDAIDLLFEGIVAVVAMMIMNSNAVGARTAIIHGYDS